MFIFSAPSAHRPGKVNATDRVEWTWFSTENSATRDGLALCLRICDAMDFFEPLMVPCRSVPFWVLHSCTVAQLRLHLFRSVHLSKHWFMHFIIT